VTEPLTPRPDQLNAFFTAAPAGLAILDGSLRYVQLNETLALMNGPSVAEHLGKSVREVLPELALRLEPMLQRILATGEPALNIEVTGETPAQPGVTRYWMASYFPLSNPSGEPQRIGAIVVEDTGRRRAEQLRPWAGHRSRPGRTSPHPALSGLLAARQARTGGPSPNRPPCPVAGLQARHRSFPVPARSLPSVEDQ